MENFVGVLEWPYPVFEVMTQEVLVPVAVPKVQIVDVPDVDDTTNSRDRAGAQDVGLSTCPIHGQSRGCSRNGTEIGPLGPESSEDGGHAQDSVYRQGGRRYPHHAGTVFSS